ncbi:ABC transporter ATP-binding protein [Rothia aerolata]|uniref:Iron ABC transporter ATP-binding protein n=1 Tax=Rothia aerolata TaxID=1812262 RepID=A0A917INT9_9MICC|nr:ABC transporter ATP-binding protein [Rothia aerolata]GGH57350.1 iron ABC transporter ATP-binding protein [Rothia aerolata]
MSAVLDLQQVTVVRGDKKLLDHVNWTVNDGEKWIVLGPNGAGKSTLLSIAGARLHPTSGSVDILDEILGAVDVFELRPRIGVSSAALTQTIPDTEKVADVVVTAAYAVTGRWNEEYDGLDAARASELLADWGIADLGERRFGSLSDGEKKRTLIARALMTDPELLLLDEPGAGMDIAGREDLVARLTELATDDFAPATILVTHHLEEIPSGFTHALMLRDGRVVASGPIEQTITEENLRETYGMDFKLSKTENGRYSAFAANNS